MSDQTQDNPAGGPESNETIPSGEAETVKFKVDGKEELAEAVKQRDEYLDLLQRTRAEFANFQRRAKTQADTDRTYAVGSLARDLLDGLDNLERATEALRASAAPGIVDGLSMVHKQLLATLAKHGIEPIAALGEPFDPNRHEAVIQQPTADQPEGTVVNELSKGYKIHDRVLRPTKVAVSVSPSEEAPAT